MKRYTIGLDYGTQSGRAVLVDVSNGEQIAESVLAYKHGVIDEYLPTSGQKLEHDWALENPDDYLEVLKTTIKKVMKTPGVTKESIIGIGIDFTACTMMPVNEQGQVLCQTQEFKNNPHAWIKLWKHHAAQDEADMLNKIATERGEDFLSLYGGKISSEWMIPKIMQIADEAPQIYAAADTFMEATDWVTMQLTGELVRSSCTAGYKAIWNKEKGFPGKEFFKALNPMIENVVEDKFKGEIRSIGTKAGELSDQMAEELGLMPGIAISVGNVDAHVSAPAVNVIVAGQMLMIMGTSTCNILLADKEVRVEGMCGVVDNGAVPGFYAYEAGQSAVGDIFEWFVTHSVPKAAYDDAEKLGMNIHSYLESKAAELKPGESGLVALDWMNGNRCVLVDTNLTGLIMGITLLTKPEEIYRALIEATAFGQRVIIDNFEEQGVAVNELFACGGLPEKNRMLMQIYADVLNREIKIADSKQTPALGSALFAALAAGKEAGGYDDLKEAAKYMSKVKEETFKPIEENVKVYDAIYKEYKLLHDYFGKGENDVMKRLKKIKEDVSK